MNLNTVTNAEKMKSNADTFKYCLHLSTYHCAQLSYITARSSSDYFPSQPLDNHHHLNAAYRRAGKDIYYNFSAQSVGENESAFGMSKHGSSEMLQSP